MRSSKDGFCLKWVAEKASSHGKKVIAAGTGGGEPGCAKPERGGPFSSQPISSLSLSLTLIPSYHSSSSPFSRGLHSQIYCSADNCILARRSLFQLSAAPGERGPHESWMKCRIVHHSNPPMVLLPPSRLRTCDHVRALPFPVPVTVQAFLALSRLCVKQSVRQKCATRKAQSRHMTDGFSGLPWGLLAKAPYRIGDDSRFTIRCVDCSVFRSTLHCPQSRIAPSKSLGLAWFFFSLFFFSHIL